MSSMVPESSPAPVYFGFGSMTLDDPEGTATLVLNAVARLGCRAVIAAGWGGLAPESFPPQVFAVDEAPHDWLLAQRGVAPDAMPRTRLTAASLSNAITLALKDSLLRDGAAALAALIRQEDGVGRAASRIEAIGVRLHC